LRETASYEPSCVKISSVVFPVEDGKKKREGKGRHKKSRKRYISPIRGEAPRKRIFTKFCTSGDMLDVIICANFGMEKLRGLGNTRGQILEFPIEMAGHLYNKAGATAQPVICDFLLLINSNLGSISHRLATIHPLQTDDDDRR